MRNEGERRTNNSPEAAKAFAKALEKGFRVTGAATVAAGGVTVGYEIVRHIESLGLSVPSVEAQTDCKVLFKTAKVGYRADDGSIRAVAQRRITLRGGGRIYPTTSDNLGTLTARSDSGQTTSKFEFALPTIPADKAIEVTATDEDETDPTKKTETHKLPCNTQGDEVFVYDKLPSNSAGTAAVIATPGPRSIVTKPVAPAQAVAKPAIQGPALVAPTATSEQPNATPPSNESKPLSFVLDWMAQHKLELLALAGGLGLMYWAGVRRGGAHDLMEKYRNWGTEPPHEPTLTELRTQLAATERELASHEGAAVRAKEVEVQTLRSNRNRYDNAIKTSPEYETLEDLNTELEEKVAEAQVPKSKGLFGRKGMESQAEVNARVRRVQREFERRIREAELRLQIAQAANYTELNNLDRQISAKERELQQVQEERDLSDRQAKLNELQRKVEAARAARRAATSA